MSEEPAIVILAAGSSSRLGRPKQLVPFKERTLLSYTIQQAKEAALGEVLVVLGAGATELEEQVVGVKSIINWDWEQGMGSSIAVAIGELVRQGSKAMILLLCDQPFVTAALIRTVAKVGKESGIALCDYGVGKGPPAYFSNAYFEALLKLSGDEGAKQIIKQAERVNYISFPKGRHDIDTEADLKMLEQ